MSPKCGVLSTDLYKPRSRTPSAKTTRDAQRGCQGDWPEIFFRRRLATVNLPITKARSLKLGPEFTNLMNPAVRSIRPRRRWRFAAGEKRVTSAVERLLVPYLLPCAAPTVSLALLSVTPPTRLPVVGATAKSLCLGMVMVSLGLGPSIVSTPPKSYTPIPSNHFNTSCTFTLIT